MLRSDKNIFKVITSSVLLPTMLLLVGCNSEELKLQAIKLNRDGGNELAEKHVQQAQEKYINALAYNPFVPELHSNLGLAFENLQLAEKAQQSYKQAEKLAAQKHEPRMEFVAGFNQAQLLGKAKKIDEAIELYQKCLDIIPSSKEVKHNIELLIELQQQQQKGSDSKDKKDQGQDGKNKQQNQGQSQDDKDQKKDSDSDKNKEDEDKKYQNSSKYKPRPFSGKDLSEGDVKKILGEIKQQESKIRAEYNRKEMKEQPRDKDW